jgi:hypothetical protein
VGGSRELLDNLIAGISVAAVPENGVAHAPGQITQTRSQGLESLRDRGRGLGGPL